MATILERYQEKFAKSAEIFESAVQRVPTGGHQSRVVRPFPLYVDDARGALKWDADGNEIIDFIMGYGALILDHAHPTVVEAVSERLNHGTIMAGASQLELKWAGQVSDLIPSAERVRFTASGTESTLMALRLARAFTGQVEDRQVPRALPPAGTTTWRRTPGSSPTRASPSRRCRR